MIKKISAATIEKEKLDIDNPTMSSRALMLLLVGTVLGAVSPDEAVHIVRCAVQGGLHVPGSPRGECHQPLGQGPCPDSEALVMEQDTLTTRCAEFPDCPGDQVWDGAQCADLECDPRETPSYSLTGEPICVCEAGWAREAEGEGACGQPSTRAWCDEGQILQETSGCNCLPYEQCPTFLKDVADLSSLRGDAGRAAEYSLGVQRLAAQVCNTEEQKICCKEGLTLDKPLSLAEVGRLLARASSQPSLECGASSCAPGTLPWPGRNCTQVSIKGRSGDCELTLTEDEEITCVDEGLAIRNVPGAFSHKCSRGKIWSRYRTKCVRRFF